jgi:hypothetical protein
VKSCTESENTWQSRWSTSFEDQEILPQIAQLAADELKVFTARIPVPIRGICAIRGSSFGFDQRPG